MLLKFQHDNLVLLEYQILKKNPTGNRNQNSDDDDEQNQTMSVQVGTLQLYLAPKVSDY